MKTLIITLLLAIPVLAQCPKSEFQKMDKEHKAEYYLDFTPAEPAEAVTA